MIISAYSYELNTAWDGNVIDTPWHNITIWSLEAAVSEIKHSIYLRELDSGSTLSEFMCWWTVVITREARDGPLSGVLPMPANEKTNLPEYFAATETRLGLLAEAVKMLEYILPNMLEGYELIQSRETPSVSFCEYELEEPSTCGDAWESTLDAFAIPQSKARQELRESLVEKTCNDTSNWHSSQSVTEGNYKPPSHEMVAMLVELDKTLLNGRIAALNASMDCPLSARYRAP